MKTQNREKLILDMRFRRKMTLQQIGVLFLMTRERVRQLIEKAIEKPRYRTYVKEYERQRRKNRTTRANGRIGGIVTKIKNSKKQ